MATGVLVVGIERATKILGLLTATDKSYAATIRLGQTTSTEDAEGEVLQTVSADARHRCADRRRGRRVARRHRRRCRRRSARSRSTEARLQAGPRGARPSNWPPRPVRIDRFEVARGRGTDGPARRRRRRGGLLVAAPTSGRWPATSAPRSVSAGISPRCGAPGRPVRAGGGAHARGARGRAAAELLAGRGVPAGIPASRLTDAGGRVGRSRPGAGTCGHRRRLRGDGARRSGHRTAGQTRRPGRRSVVVIRPATL